MDLSRTSFLCSRRSLSREILEEPFVAPLLPPLLKRHELSIGILRERTECKEATIFFDVTDHDLEGYNKFVPYYLHPESVYSVGLSKSSFRVKVSVGSNPWAPQEPEVNLARICERYGGGGHARVGAISFNVDQHAEAIKASQEIVSELRAAIRAATRRSPSRLTDVSRSEHLPSACE